MSGGYCSEFTTRRTNFDKCKFWKRDDENSSLEEYTIKNDCNGFFYAKEVNAQMSQKNVVGNMFMFDQNTITIETFDSIDELSAGDIVVFRDSLWNILSVQKSTNSRSEQFLKNSYFKSYIQMRK